MIDKQIQNKKQKYAEVKGVKNMTDELIIKNWKIGITVKSIAKKYKEEEDKKRKRVGEDKITDKEAWSYVEKLIYKYQTGLMKGE